MKKTVALILATGLGSGYSPFAPGTVGSVVGLIIVYVLSMTGMTAYFGVLAAVFALGVWSAGVAEVHYGQKDCGKITIDEVAGMLITMMFIPAGGLMLLSGFLLFRLLDIVKPFPAGIIDRKLGGGMGVMLDDVFAGIYANLCLHGMRALLS